MKIKNSILLVINPISGGIDKSKLIEAVKAEINKRNYSLEIYKTSDDKYVWSGADLPYLESVECRYSPRLFAPV